MSKLTSSILTVSLSLVFFSCEKKDHEFDWIDVSTGIGATINCIDMVDEKTGYIGVENNYDYSIINKVSDKYLLYQFYDSICYSNDTSIFNFEYKFNEPLPYKTIYFTKDGGNSWKGLETPFKGNIVSLDFINEYTGYVIVSPEGIYKTSDGGKKWRKILNGNLITGINGRNASNMNHFDLQAINEKYVYFYNKKDAFVFNSSDENNNVWTTNESPLNSSIFTNGVQYLKFFNGIEVGYASSYQGVFKTLNAGNTWEKIYDKVNNVQFVNSTYGIIEQAGVRMITKNAGVSWENFTIENAFNYNTYFLDENSFLLFKKNNNFYEDFYTLNNKKEFPELLKRDVNNSIYDICFINARIGYAVGSKGMVLKLKID
jgi:hypothetical protein